MRICFLCSEYPPGRHGGIGTFTQVTARKLVRAGHHVRVVGHGVCADWVLRRERDEGVDVFRLSRTCGKWGWIRERYELFRMVQKWALDGEIDVVEAPDYQGWIAGWSRLPVPVLVRLQGAGTYFAHEMGDNVSLLTRRIEGAALRRADFLCSASRYTARQTELIFRLPSIRTVIYNAVEVPPEPAPRAARDPNLVVFSGTLVEKKGIAKLIEAWALVKSVSPAATLYVFGKDGRTANGESMRDTLIRELPPSLRWSVAFKGHATRDVLFESLRRARAAVFPSFSEAFALSPLEAMAQACPTIHTILGSGPEMLENGREGILVDPHRPESIASGIVRLLQDDELAARLGQAGWQRVRSQFSDDVIIPRNEALYSHCCREFACRRQAYAGEAPHAA